MLFSGCTLGPDFTRPASPDTKSYTTGKQSNRITTTSSESGAAQTLALGKDIQGPVVDAVPLPGIDQTD